MKSKKRKKVETLEEAEKRIKAKIRRLIARGKYKEALESIFG